jgi:hypothetical protein
MTIFGYGRVSTDGQTLASQDAQLHAAGAAKVYAEKVSGAKTERAELAMLLKRLEPGDVLMVRGSTAWRGARAICSTSSTWSPRPVRGSGALPTPGPIRRRHTGG